MSRFFRVPSSSILALTLVAGIAVGQESEQPSGQSEVNSAEDAANRAIAELAAWNTKEARKILKKERGKHGSTPAFQTAWALLEIQEGADKSEKMVDQGVNDLSKASRMKSFEAVASYYEGEILYQQDKRDEARTAWNVAAARAAELTTANKNDATAQFYLGAASIRLKKFASGRKALRIALQKDFDPAMVHHQIGLSYLYQKKWGKAKEQFDTGLEIRPRYAPMYYWRGMAWDKLGRKDNMLIDLDQYVRLAPNGPEASRARAVLASAG